MDWWSIVMAAATTLVVSGCDQDSGPAAPSTTATVRIVFMGSTVRRTDLPRFADACVDGVGMTHIHPSWRSFAAIPLQPVPPGRYEMTAKQRRHRPRVRCALPTPTVQAMRGRR
jgi:hypothetical protein